MSKPADTKPAAKAEVFKARLLKPHTHCGALLGVGETIELTAPEREFLRSVGVIATPTTNDAAPAVAE